MERTERFSTSDVAQLPSEDRGVYLPTPSDGRYDAPNLWLDNNYEDAGGSDLPNCDPFLDVTKPLLRTSRTALRRPIRFLLRRPNRRQDRRSLRRSFPENLITCIATLIPHVTHHVQSSCDSRLSRFHEVSELLSQPPPVSIRKDLFPHA